MEHSEVTNLLEAYALGALDPEQAITVEAHIRGCSSCTGKLAGYQRVTAAMPAALAQASPFRLHPATRDRLLARLEAEPAERPAAPDWQRGPRLGWRAAVAAAAGLALAASLLINYQQSQALAQKEQTVLRQETLNKIRVQDVSTVIDVLDSSQKVTRQLRTTGAPAADGRTPYGKVISRNDASTVVAMVNYMPQPDPGQEYELWLVSGPEVRFAGAIPVDSTGFGYLILTAARKGPSYQGAIVTAQAPGGKQPGGTVVLTWEGTH